MQPHARHINRFENYSFADHIKQKDAAEVAKLRRELKVQRAELDEKRWLTMKTEGPYTPHPNLQATHGLPAPPAIDLWGTLYRIMLWRLPKELTVRPDKHRWLVNMVQGMSQEYAEGTLQILKISHPLLKMGDDGLRRIGRWLIDNIALLEGVRRIEMVGNAASSVGLVAVANALPLSCIEVDAVANTGNNWPMGIAALARALKVRGGGRISCGKALPQDVSKLNAMLSAFTDDGGEVDISVICWGAIPETLILPATSSLAALAA
eukprot:gene11483-17664_t